MTTTEGNTGTATTLRTINEANLKSIILNHSPAGSIPASDVSSWAKASTKPSYTASDVDALPLTGGTVGGNLQVTGSMSADAGLFVQGNLYLDNGVLTTDGGGITYEGDWFDFGGAKLQNLDAPSALSDAATKGYVDSRTPTYTWNEIDNKPSWIGSSKPTYDLSEISETTTYKRVSQSEKTTSNNKEPAISTGDASYF